MEWEKSSSSEEESSNDSFSTSSDTFELENYIRRIEPTFVEFNRRFQLMNSSSSFVIESLPADPEELLEEIFNNCIEKAIKEAKEKGLEPDRLGAIISSPLLDPSIWLPIREITPNTADTILNRFTQVSQSKEDNSIYGEPFTVVISLLDKKKLPFPSRQRGRGKIRGAGRPRAIFEGRLAPKHVVKTSALIPVKNAPNRFCLFYALHLGQVYGSKRMDRRIFGKYITRDKKKLQNGVYELMENVGVPQSRWDYAAETFVPRIVNFWNRQEKKQQRRSDQGPLRYKVFIFGEHGHCTPKYKYGPENYNVPVILYHNNGHFDTIRNISSFFNARYYCLSCESSYSHQREHNCKQSCRKCGRAGLGRPCPADEDQWEGAHFGRKCKDCNKWFQARECYRHHLKSRFCQASKQCAECGEIWLVKDNCRDGRTGHKCDEKWCQLCVQYHSKERGCFITTIKPKEIPEYRAVAFDFETILKLLIDALKGMAQQPRRKHQVNFVSAHVGCSICFENGDWKHSLKGRQPCPICGPNRTVTFGHRGFKRTEVDMHVICEDPLASFVHWIIYELPIKYETMAWSHYGGRFDMIFVYRLIYQLGICPLMIRKAHKLYQLEVPAVAGENGRIVFKDSYNILPSPLDSLIGAFDLREVAMKPFFPYFYNTPANYDVKLPGLPPPEDYDYNGMRKEKRTKFLQFYEANKNEGVFELNEELAAYGKNDTAILMHALVAFRAEFLAISQRGMEELEDGMEMDVEEEEEALESSTSSAASDSSADEASSTASSVMDVSRGKEGVKYSREHHPGIDILYDGLTISSAAMRHYRLNHLKPGHIGIVPASGYDVKDNQSHIALQYLYYYGKKHGLEIQTALHKGEKRIGRYRVDGYCQERDLAIEFNGCVFHGCPRCFPEDWIKMKDGKTAGFHREKDRQRLRYIRQRVRHVKVVWECEVREQFTRDEEMQRAFDELEREEGSPLDIRDSFFGGRCAPLKLYHEAGPDETIKHLDFCSLYPLTCYRTAYGVGIPKLHKFIGNKKKVNWTRPEDCKWRGFLKCFVIPPERLDPPIPVLPVKIAGKLQFPLCAQCCHDFPDGGYNPNYSCKHGPSKRGWVSTCTSVELKEALAVGYRVTKLYRVLEYEKWDSDLFKGYIREFAAIKLQSSGFPHDCVTVEQRAKFIQECMDEFCIELEEGKMVMDKARRTIAKFFLNQLWGKFSMRNGLRQSEVCDDPAKLRSFLENRKLEIISIDELTPDAVLITYENSNKEFIEEHAVSNVAISSWTTSCARILLLKAMQKVASDPNSNLLYDDTDSLIFSHKIGQNPLEELMGWHLGQLTDEIDPQKEIVEFASSGCKAWGIRVWKKGMPRDDPNSYEYELKVKGITLTHENCKRLNYETFKQKVLAFGSGRQCSPIPVRYPNSFRPDVRKGEVMVVHTERQYKPVVTKGIVGSDFKVIDFGTKRL